MKYFNTYVVDGAHAYGTSNWELDGNRRIIRHGTNSSNAPDSRLKELDSATALQLQSIADTGIEGTGNSNPFYLVWAGQDGTDNDMGGVMSSYTSGNVKSVEIEFTYHFQCSYNP